MGLFLVVTAGTLALLLALSEIRTPAQRHLRRRLARESAVVEPPDIATLYKNLEAPADVTPSKPDGDLVSFGKPSEAWLVTFLREAGVPMRPRVFIATVCLGAFLLGTLSTLVVGWVPGVAVYLLAMVVPAFALNIRRQVRRDRYVKQLAVAFEMMARVLKSGQPVQEAFRAAVQGGQEPLAGEFGRCLHEIEHGIRPEEAYRELSQRAGILELRIFIVAMMIQRQTGGSLTDVLERLATVVRTRIKLRQKIRALTAEGRMQSTTLLFLPVLTFFMMYFLNRPYAEALLLQWKMLFATAALMGTGVLWIRNIMNFDG